MSKTGNPHPSPLPAALAVLLILVLAPAARSDEDPLRVVTTIPDLADMARAVGGDLVQVKSITRGTEDMHLVPAKPSHLILLNRADVLIQMGLDNEHAWLPELIRECRNDRIQPGAPGFINCSAGITVLERYEDPSRREGEIHPEGNPHYNVDPLNGPVMARNICRGLCRAAPDHAATFRKNLEAYSALLDRKLGEWEELAKPLAGTRIVVYHRSWSYFVQRYGLVVVGEIEPKPGIAPTPGHVADLIRRIRSEGAELVIKEPFYSDKVPRLLQEKTGVPFINLPNMSGGTPETATYVDLIEHNIKTLLAALGKPVEVKSEEG